MENVDGNDHLENSRKPDESEQIDFKPLEKSESLERDLVKKQKIYSVDSLNQQLLSDSL